jgi:hypothetical protein
MQAGRQSITAACEREERRISMQVQGIGNPDVAAIQAWLDEEQSKADCKKGGYKEFGFKNQGQCIASLQRNDKATR